jgi:hypothetical protein
MDRIAPTALFLPASATRGGSFGSASGAWRGGFLFGATCTGFSPASGAACFFLGLGATCIRFGPASSAFAIGAPGDSETGAGNQAGNAQPGQHLFELVHFHAYSPPFRIIIINDPFPKMYRKKLSIKSVIPAALLSGNPGFY